MSGPRDRTVARTLIRTLGHSRHPIAKFIDLLEANVIATVVDVRGQPFSRFNPQYNRNAFRDALEAAGIAYVWQGERLSGRPKDRRFYGADGKVDWEAVRAWPALSEGLDEVAALAAESPIVLVCAEEDPLRCHRRFLLTRPLIDRGCEILHIRGDGSVASEAETAQRERGADPDQSDLFARNRPGR